MTFEQLLSVNDPDDIAKLSTEEIKKILPQTLTSCPPKEAKALEKKAAEKKIKQIVRSGKVKMTKEQIQEILNKLPSQQKTSQSS